MQGTALLCRLNSIPCAKWHFSLLAGDRTPKRNDPPKAQVMLAQSEFTNLNSGSKRYAPAETNMGGA